MTYGILDLFSQLFRTTSDEYRLGDEKIIGHIPSMSDYNSHLSGKSALHIVPKNRIGFVIGKAVNYTPFKIESPLVTMKIFDDYFVALFFKESLPVVDAYRILTEVCKYYQIGIVKEDEFMLPLFNGLEDNFTVLNKSGESFAYIDDVLEYLRSKQSTVEDIDNWKKSLLYSDAPPCVQTRYLINGEIDRDFYNGNVYLWAKGIENAEDNIGSYKCENCLYCSKAECKTRKYCPSSNYISDVTFGKLVQYRDNPMYYKWELNGKEVRFDSELDIMKQDRFITICFRYLNILPNRVTDNTWNRIVNRALKDIEIVGAEKIQKGSTEILKSILTVDLRSRTLVSPYFEYERFMQGYMYLSPANLTINVSPESLIVYLSSIKNNMVIDDMNDLFVILKHLGFRKRRKQIEDIRCAIWYLRSEFLFENREDWKNYLLKVSEGTMWEENFKAFLIENAESDNGISEEDMASIDSDADVFLDTEN